MKKHIITLLFLSTFAGVMAQSDTNFFNILCTQVIRTDDVADVLYEQVLSFRDLNRDGYSIAGTNTNKSACTPRNKYSLGISAFCSFVGVSLKCQLKEHLYLQTDLGGNAYLNFLFIPVSPTLGADFGAQVYLLYEDLFPKRTNTYWIAGVGLNFAGYPHIPYSNQVSLKGGAKAILGIEYIPDNSRLSFQVDTRWGYGIIYSTKGVNPRTRNGEISDANPYHFLDYGFVFTLRFHFGKKN